MTDSGTGPTAKAVGVMAIIFVSGVATGLLASRLVDFLAPQRGTQFRIEATVQDLAERLTLNPSQIEDIQAILDDLIMEEAELLGELQWNQMEAHERILRFLTPEQADRFRSLVQDTGETE
ncbi:MAG: hypothetical protein OXN89_13805 [Bryobacterales bacterium]|nr:hypothetical protein [Bryobacterales bacterium]